jgi:tRNA-splicing ligase RtcB
MSRKASLNLQEEKRKLEKRQGIIHSIRHKNDLEESLSACKDIAQVMAFQSDLVKILVELSPLEVIKARDN